MYLGIDIGGTFIKYAIVDDNNEIVKAWKVPTIKFETKDEFYDYICLKIEKDSDFDAIGVSAPGLIDEESNVKSPAAPNVVVMYGTNINEEIGRRTGKKVSAINDAKAAGFCEFTIGNAKGTKSSAFLIIGTGTGGCVCDDKGVVFGKDSFAGEFHNLCFMNLKEERLDSMGDYSSMTGLLNMYNEGVGEEEKVKYGKEVCERYLNGEEKAIKVIDKWTNFIIVQLLTMTSFYNPEVICLGGGISEEDWFLDIIKKKYKENCVKFFRADVITTEIKRCKYNNNANILGAILNQKCK